MWRRALRCALSSGAHLTCGHRFIANAHIATMAKRHEARTLLSLLLKCDQNGRRSGMFEEGTKPLRLRTDRMARLAVRGRNSANSDSSEVN